MDGWTDEWMDRLTCVWTNDVDRWMDIYIDEQMDEHTNK